MICKFVLLSTQRSGSTWVIDMLNSHPAVIAYSELLLEGASGRPKWGGAKDRDFWNDYFETARARRPSMDRRDLLFEYLDSVYAARNDCRAIGFKLMYGQFGAFPELLDYMEERDVAVVPLIRENPVDVLLSKAIAVQRGVFHSRGEESPGVIKVSLNPGELLSRLHAHQTEVEQKRKTFSRSGLSYLEVFYEELMSDCGRFGAVLELLGAAPEDVPLTSCLRKLNKVPHSQSIENYEAVANVLHQTPFERFLR
jgi:LPS sulfotransferase NodH